MLPDLSVESTPEARPAADRRGHAADILFLASVLAVSQAWYARGLGLYADDWFYMGAMSRAAHAPLADLFQSVEYTFGRPVHVAYLTAMFKVAGLTPAAFHMVNGLVLTAAVVFFYLSLRHMGAQRVTSLGIALIFGLLPNYAATRFWISAAHFNLAMALCFVSLYAGLHSLEAMGWRKAAWQLLSASVLAASVLACEVALPLFGLSLAAFAYLSFARAGHDTHSPAARLSWAGWSLVVVNALVLVGVLIFKLAVNDRPAQWPTLGRTADVARNALAVGFYSPHGWGIGLPRAAAVLGLAYGDATTYALAAVIGVAIAWYLSAVARRERFALPSRRRCMAIAGSGLLLYMSAYSLALFTSEVGFAPTGVVTRTAIGPAVGVAVFQWAVVMFLIPRSGGERSRSWLAASFVAALSVACFVVIGGLASMWTAASQRQQEVLTALRRDAPALPSGSAVMLDGVCSYIGPAVVFEAHWDFGEAVKLAYADPTLRGDVVTRRLSIGDDRLSSYVYTPESPHDGSRSGAAAPASDVLRHCCRTYPYGDRLFVYNAAERHLAPITNREAARAYFDDANHRAASGCRGIEGVGIPVF